MKTRCDQRSGVIELERNFSLMKAVLYHIKGGTESGHLGVDILKEMDPPAFVENWPFMTTGKP